MWMFHEANALAKLYSHERSEHSYLNRKVTLRLF